MPTAGDDSKSARAIVRVARHFDAPSATRRSGVSATDVATYALVAVALTVVSVLASFAPAARAAGSDPAAVPRAE